MGTVAPSQIPPLIDQCFPWAALPDKRKSVKLEAVSAAKVAGILGAVEAVPERLIVLSNEDFAEFVAAKASIRQALASWEGVNPLAESYRYLYADPTMFRYDHPIASLRETMAKCPDEAPSPRITGLAFLPGPALRDELRSDISRAESALNNGEFKAATVLAGSAAEALLWWGLTHLATKAGDTIEVKALLHDDLHNLIKKAAATPPNAPLISAATKQQATAAREYRNLIHQGRAERKQQVCDRGTAHAALAAVYDVIREFMARPW